MNLFTSAHRGVKVFGIGFSILLMVVVSYSPPATPRAEGQWAVIDAAKIAWDKFAKGVDWVYEKAKIAIDYMMKWLAFVGNGIAWKLVNVILQKMSQDIIRWVRSGFKGKPAFVQNIDRLLLDAADQVAGEFFMGNELEFLCSPFRLEVRAALAISYNNSRGTKGFDSQCKLSSVVRNVDKFLKGDLSQGGWRGWFELTQNPINNPHGAFLEAQTEMSARIVNAKGQEIKLAEFGKGFLSKKVCESNGPGEPESCKIVTPGSMIEDQLNESIKIPGRRLVAADQINEIIGTLFYQLGITMLSGKGGLLGLSSPDPSNGGRVYIDAMMTSTSTEGFSFSGDGETTEMEKSLKDEQRYLALLQRMYTLIQNGESYKDDTYGRSNSCHSGDLPASLKQRKENLLTEGNDVQLLVAALQQLIARYKAASTNPDEQAKIMELYFKLLSQGKLHDEATSMRVENQTIPALQDEIAAFRQEVDSACNTSTGGGA